jgi:hypothetical protein
VHEILQHISAAILGAFVAVVANSGWIVSAILGGVSALLTWIATNYVGKPILAIEAERRRAIQVAMTMQWTPPYGASDAEWHRVLDARGAIREIGNSLRSYARTTSRPVRLYCQWRSYHLEDAADAMDGLASMTGDPRDFADERRNNIDLLHIRLKADAPHLTPKRIAEVEQMVAVARAEAESRRA